MNVQFTAEGGIISCRLGGSTMAISQDYKRQRTRHQVCSLLCSAGIYMHAMQVQNRALQGGLVFTRWLWFLGPVHGFGMIWTASFLLAVLRITTATLVSTWYAFQLFLRHASLSSMHQPHHSCLMCHRLSYILNDRLMPCHCKYCHRHKTVHMIHSV